MHANAAAAIKVPSWRINAASSRSRRSSFISFMVTALLLPLADVAAAGFQFISAWEALRGFRAICAVPSAS